MKLLNKIINDSGHNGCIDIVDGEQFVPLYLSQLYKSQAHLTGEFSSHSFKAYTTLEADNLYDNLNNKDYNKKKTLIKQAVKNILDGPVVTSYSLNVENGNHLNYLNYSDIIDYFSGCNVNKILYCNNNNHFLRFGMFGGVTNNDNVVITSLQSNLYQSFNYYPELQLERYIPYLLIVVKAKHLKYIRAKVYTSQPYSLPHSDIMLLVNSKYKTEKYVKELYSKGLSEFIKSQEMKVIYKTTEELQKYMFKRRKDKTAEETMKDALFVYENESLFANYK